MYKEVHLQSKIVFIWVFYPSILIIIGTINTDLHQSADEDAIDICTLTFGWEKYFLYLNSEYYLQANICFTLIL